MTENDARDQVEQIVGRAATERLDRFAYLVVAENERQNIIARSTIDAIWNRHILDSIQLLNNATDNGGKWIDIGTGGGFPGLAIAIATKRDVLMVEPRRRRADFLEAVGSEFHLRSARVSRRDIRVVDFEGAEIISARAVAPIADLFDKASRCASVSTRWLLPRGEGWQSDVARAMADWNGVFHVEQSLSNPSARIVVATEVKRR